MGKPAEPEDIVNIFDYEENEITQDIQEQRDYYKRWIESLTE
ncbi:hypothetical protein V466_07460 [Pseudomonas mandelii PD30]|uniref:Uncharacterized protein n=2 Tax=Pseudomonas mandelii TaxID=75612 RepID=A0A059L630_9PSED|nr:hypothetical protein V466_07460 [Pseudomonas mandelii PD30]